MGCFNFSSGTLQHNTVYKFRLTAVNAGHKQLNTTVESNGGALELSLLVVVIVVVAVLLLLLLFFLRHFFNLGVGT